MNGTHGGRTGRKERWEGGRKAKRRKGRKDYLLDKGKADASAGHELVLLILSSPGCHITRAVRVASFNK